MTPKEVRDKLRKKYPGWLICVSQESWATDSGNRDEFTCWMRDGNGGRVDADSKSLAEIPLLVDRAMETRSREPEPVGAGVGK